MSILYRQKNMILSIKTSPLLLFSEFCMGGMEGDGLIHAARSRKAVYCHPVLTITKMAKHIEQSNIRYPRIS